MGLENLLKYIEAITLLLPLIEKIVTMIEGLFAKMGPGQGAAKKEAAIDFAKIALLNAGLDLPDEALSAMIDSQVKIINQTGGFKAKPIRAPPFPGSTVV
jgi:hypothetical protein